MSDATIGHRETKQHAENPETGIECGCRSFLSQQMTDFQPMQPDRDTAVSTSACYFSFLLLG